MAQKKFTEEFGLNIEPEVEELTEYETFPNKILSDEPRNKTIQNLIDAGYLKQSDIEKNKDIISSEMYIEVIRNKKNKVIISQTLVNNNSVKYLCPYIPIEK